MKCTNRLRRRRRPDDPSSTPRVLERDHRTRLPRAPHRIDPRPSSAPVYYQTTRAHRTLFDKDNATRDERRRDARQRRMKRIRSVVAIPGTCARRRTMRRSRRRTTVTRDRVCRRRRRRRRYPSHPSIHPSIHPTHHVSSALSCTSTHRISGYPSTRATFRANRHRWTGSGSIDRFVSFRFVSMDGRTFRSGGFTHRTRRVIGVERLSGKFNRSIDAIHGVVPRSDRSMRYMGYRSMRYVRHAIESDAGWNRIESNRIVSGERHRSIDRIG